MTKRDMNFYLATIRAYVPDFDLATEIMGYVRKGFAGDTDDYMSLSDAKKHWQKYIDIEMRDPCGLNEDAKAALTLLRNLQPKPIADVELMAKVYEEEREEYLCGTIYYRNNQEASEAAMTKALQSQGYITQGWKPIETVLKNKMILGYVPQKLGRGGYSKYYVVCERCEDKEHNKQGQPYFFDEAGDYHFPTHWMPLPTPPQKE